MKYIRILIIVSFIIYAGIKIHNAQKYNANDPHSLEIMLKLINPNERISFIKDFELAAKDQRATNLHGLTKDEIIDISRKKREILKEKKITFLKNVISMLEEKGMNTIRLAPDASRLPVNGYPDEEYALDELKMMLENLSQ